MYTPVRIVSLYSASMWHSGSGTSNQIDLNPIEEICARVSAAKPDRLQVTTTSRLKAAAQPAHFLLSLDSIYSFYWRLSRLPSADDELSSQRRNFTEQSGARISRKAGSIFFKPFLFFVFFFPNQQTSDQNSSPFAKSPSKKKKVTWYWSPLVSSSFSVGDGETASPRMSPDSRVQMSDRHVSSLFRLPVTLTPPNSEYLIALAVSIRVFFFSPHSL